MIHTVAKQESGESENSANEEQTLYLFMDIFYFHQEFTHTETYQYVCDRRDGT